MDLINEGQKIALYIQKQSTVVEMTCTIEKVFYDRLSLTLPQYFMRYIEFLQVGKEHSVKVFSKLGTIDFNTIIINSPMEDSFVIEMDYNSMHLTPSEEIPFIKAVESLILTNSANKEFKVKTFEISTSYIKFSTDKKLVLNENLNCILNLPNDYGIINFSAVISEIDPIYDNEYKIDFITMTENDRQSLLYYMYMYSKDIE